MGIVHRGGAGALIKAIKDIVMLHLLEIRLQNKRPLLHVEFKRSGKMQFSFPNRHTRAVTSSTLRYSPVLLNEVFPEHPKYKHLQSWLTNVSVPY